jgi:hypothetical protein
MHAIANSVTAPHLFNHCYSQMFLQKSAYLTNYMEQSLFGKLIVAQLPNKFPAFNGDKREVGPEVNTEKTI